VLHTVSNSLFITNSHCYGIIFSEFINKIAIWRVMKLCFPLSTRPLQTGGRLQLEVVIKTQKGDKVAVK
jgi:hypothetical protein